MIFDKDPLPLNDEKLLPELYHKTIETSVQFKEMISLTSSSTDGF